MACEFSANIAQTVLSNQPVIFTETPVPCEQGFVFHRDESGNFLLASRAPRPVYGCGCGRPRIYETRYNVEFHANIAIPEGGTVEEIQLAVVLDGDTDPSSIMRFTPTAVDVYGNIGASIIVAVPSLCGCSNVSIRNISTQDILVQNANLIIAPEGIKRVM